MTEINWTATLGLFMHIGIAAYLLSQGHIPEAVAILAGTGAMNLATPGFLPSSPVVPEPTDGRLPR